MNQFNNFDQYFDFVAPHNSTIDSGRISQRNDTQNFEWHSAPPPTVNTSGIRSTPLFEGDMASQNSSETYLPVSRCGVSVDNDLKARLYKSGMNSQAIQHCKVSQYRSNPFNKWNTKLKPSSKLERKRSALSSRMEDLKNVSHETSSLSNASDLSSRKQYLNKSILEIIAALFDRLNWASDGIIQGEIPIDNGRNIGTVGPRLDDDGEFVYALPREHILRNAPYNPYDLVHISSKKAEECETYFTVSASYISRVSQKEGTTLLPILDWLYERKMFYKIYQLNVFKTFRIWKSFVTWKKTLRFKKKDEHRCGIEKKLFQTCPTFQNTILQIKNILNELCYNSNHNANYQTLLCFDTSKTYDLMEFYELQLKQCDKVKNVLLGSRENILQLVHDTCQRFYKECYAEIGRLIKDMQTKELVKKLNAKSPKVYNNFQVIKEKYNLQMKSSQPESISIAEENGDASFKYTKASQLKAVYQRIRSFVRLVDFLVSDALRALVVTSMRVLQAQCSASYSCDGQPNLYNLYQWTCPESETLSHSSSEAVPLFNIYLVLNSDDEKFHIGTERNVSPPNKSCTSLNPSRTDFENIFCKIFKEFESTVSSFESFSTDSLLQPLVKEPSCYDVSKKSHNIDKRDLHFEDDEFYQGCLKEIKEELNQGFDEVQIYVKAFDSFCNMVDSANLLEVRESLKTAWTTEQFYGVLNQYTEQVAAMDEMLTESRKALFLVKTDGFKTSCLPYPRAIISEVNKHLPKVANQKNEALLKLVKGGERKLSAPIKSIEDFVEHLSFLSKISAEIPKISKEFTIISRLFFVAFKYKAEFTAEEKALYQTLAPSFHQLKTLVMYCEAKKDENIHKFSKDLDSILNNLMKQLHELTIQIRNPSLLDEDMSPGNVMETLKYLEDDLKQLSTNARNFSTYESIFTSSLSRSQAELHSVLATEKPISKAAELLEELSSVEKDLTLRLLLWQSIKEWDDLHQQWKSTPFAKLDVGGLLKEMSRFVQVAYLLEKGLPSNSLLPSLKKKIMIFKAALPVISSLHNTALKSRHWVEINKVTGTVIKEDRLFLLGDLINQNIFQHKERISSISTQASNEATLEHMLNKVKDYWKATDLQLIAHSSKDVAIITGVDDILASLDDSMVTLANIRGSRYSFHLQAQINEWDRKLSLFLHTFEEWVSVQRNWLYLETVFSTSDIQRQLPNEAKLFVQVDKNWRDIMRRTIDKPNALMATTSTGLLDVLQACNSNLEKIHRSLEDYLETKRLVFSRFYFLSNEELLDILANNKNVHAVQPYLSKCFANVQKLSFDVKQRAPVPICEIFSSEGEVFKLPKSLKARGQVEQWLANLECAMCDTVKLLLKQALSEFSQHTFIDFITSYYGQIVLTVTQVIFSKDVTKALTLKGAPDLTNLLNQYIYKLEVVAAYVKKKLSEKERNVAVALIITLVHSRDIILKLVENDVDSIEAFQWKRQLRYYWDEDVNNCLVSQTVATFTYGYEYLGCSSRLVITPLTERCYLTLTSALHFHLGGAPCGPAGTGKSETVKDLAKNLGKHCIIFNCSESVDFKMIGRFLSGISQSGSWCCFDEFNRLDREVLSVIAQQLHVIRSAKMSSSIRFMFEGHDIKLNSSSGVFITMNPTYAGRVELPDNLKSMFRPISMVTPDNAFIAEIVLFSNGFSKAADLSQKLVKVYELAKKQLSQQHHYDFGLRAIKAVLLMAGERSVNNQVNNTDEKSILIDAISESNYPKLVYEDLRLFQQILQDVFLHSSVESNSTENILEKAIGIALRELLLQKWPSQVQKILQLYNTLNIRHGVMLVGPTGGGKTTVRKLLKRAITIQESGRRISIFDKPDPSIQQTKGKFKTIVDMVTMNPKSLTLGELYGEFDSNTTEWSDGLLSSTIRGFVERNSESNNKDQKSATYMKRKLSVTEEIIQGDQAPLKSKHQWLVLDGPVDTLWVENLNTMLDDSKLLCLANGERISLLPSMRVIFEVDSLVQASPATISRCGMIFLDPSDLGWKPTVKSWIHKLRDVKLLEEGRDHLWNLFEGTVDPGYEFLKQHKHYCLMNVPLLSIVRTLCNFLDAFLKFLSTHGGFGECTTEQESSNEDIFKDSNEEKIFLGFSNLLLDYSEEQTPKPTKSKLFLEKHPQELKVLLTKLYLFSYMWSFGGHFDCLAEEAEDLDQNVYVPSFHDEDINVRHLFDSFLRHLFEQKFDVQFPAGANLLYSYYVDLEKGQFVLWDHLVINATIQLGKVISHSALSDITMTTPSTECQTMKRKLIPTPHTICYEFLIALLSLNDCPVLLSGPVGVGKTVLIRDILQRLSEPGGGAVTCKTILGSALPSIKPKRPKDASLASTFDTNSKQKAIHDDILVSEVTFSAHCDANKPKKALQSKLVKRGRSVLSSKHGEKVLLFVDDLNMPLPGTFGCQSALEVLREYLEYGGFYDTKQSQWKELFNVTLISACGINESKRKVNERLLQKFSTFCLPQQSSQSLHHIYYTQLSRFIDSGEFSAEVRSTVPDIISTLLGLFHKVSKGLRVTPLKSHYLFNLRDITKVVKGLMFAHPTVIKTKDNFIELLINEVSRVFLDRLICDSDRTFFYDQLLDQIHDFLKIKWSQDRLFNHNGIFGDFLEQNVSESKRVYQCVRNQKKVLQVIEDYHDRGKLSGKKVAEDLVLFPEMCQHIVSAARVLKQPGGHLLILGIGGTGKTSAVQLASYLEFCEFVSLECSRTYDINDFKEDFRKIMLKVGVQGMKIVFYITDRNIVKESFLEIVCNVLDGSDFSLFFDGEAKETIALELNSEASTQDVADTVDAKFDFFETRVRKNLHIVFSTSPSGTSFHQRCQMYPTLIKNCTIDYFLQWPCEALHIVANKFISAEMSSAMLNKLVSVLVATHGYVEKMCHQYHDELQRLYHVTPKSFLNFLRLFNSTYNDMKEKLAYKKDRLLSGLQKLDETNGLVTKMEAELYVLGPKLEQKSKDTEAIMVEIQKDQQQLEKVRAVVKTEQEVTDQETKKVEAVANEAQRDLDSALPQLEAATAALDALNKYDIGEIRSYANPPIMVMTVLSAVCIILNEKPDWPTAKLLLADPNFLKKLVKYDYDNVSDKIYNRLKKYTKQSDFNPITVGKISAACKSMCSWVLALQNYTAVSRVVRPKQERCKHAQDALQAARENLLAKEISLKKVEEQVEVLEKQHKESVAQLDQLKRSKKLTIKRLERASLLIKALLDEKDRWKNSLKELDDEWNYLISNALLLSAATSYLGPFTPFYRSSFIKFITETSQIHGINVHEDFDLIGRNVDSVTVQDWRNCGLPHDNHSVQNAMFIQKNTQWPYIIDPQQQALKWIKKKEKGIALKILQANDANLMRTLESAIRLGETVIMQNATTVLDGGLDPILLKKNLDLKDDQTVINLGGTEIEYNPNFKLYILTNESNPKLLPELCIKMNVINFIVTMEGLTEQMLSKVVQQENPEIEHQLNKLLELLVNERFRLAELEDRSLNLLHTSKGNILDDEDLIQTLDHSKKLAEDIKKELSVADETQRQLSQKRQLYLPLAKHGAMLYFVASDLSSINRMYQFSLQWFTDLFSKCTSSPSKGTVESGSRPSSARSRLELAKEFSSASRMLKRKIFLLSGVDSTNKEVYVEKLRMVLTETFYKVVSYALFGRHQLLFVFYLTARIQLYTSEQGLPDILTEKSYKALLQKTHIQHDNTTPSEHLKESDLVVNKELANIITTTQLEECEELSKSLPSFGGLCQHMRKNPMQWRVFLNAKKPYEKFHDLQDHESTFKPLNLNKFERILLIKILRPNDFIEEISSFVVSVMGKEFITPSGFDLQDLYAESNCRTPIMFVLSPGSDPSSHLLKFVKEIRGSVLHLEMISLGRSQGPRALAAIKKGYTQKGSWVFLQNCHLALSFMPQLEGMIRELSDSETNVHPMFRLWLSSKPDPMLPVSIMQYSMKVTVEPPPGIRNNLHNWFAQAGGVITESLFEEQSIHPSWKELVYSCCLFHAVVQERKKFGAFGWKMEYEFISADLEVAVLMLQELLTNSTDIPWQALQLLTGEIVYGGRVTDDWDCRCLLTLLKKFYTVEISGEDFSYCNTKSYKPPCKSDGFYECIKLIEAFPPIDLPQIFGMHEEAMCERNKEDGAKLLNELRLMQPASKQGKRSAKTDDEEIIAKINDVLKVLPEKIEVILPKTLSANHAKGASHSPAKQAKGASHLPANQAKGASHSPFRPLVSSSAKSKDVQHGLASETKVGVHAENTTEILPSAISTFLGQEIRRYNTLLSVIHSTLPALKRALLGEILLTEELAELSQSVVLNKIPEQWKPFSYLSNKTLSSWISNLRDRIDFVGRWYESVTINDPAISRPPRAVWLSSLFYPQGLLTGVLQNHARKTTCAVDTLQLRCAITDQRWVDDDCQSDKAIHSNKSSLQRGERVGPTAGIVIYGLFLDGARWNFNERCLEKRSVHRRIFPLPELHLIPEQINSSSPSSDDYDCPVYQTSCRRNNPTYKFSNFVTSILIPSRVEKDEWILNGVAAICQTDD